MKLERRGIAAVVFMGVAGLAATASAGQCTTYSGGWYETIAYCGGNYGYGQGTTLYGQKALLASKASNPYGRWVGVRGINSSGKSLPNCGCTDSVADGMACYSIGGDCANGVRFAFMVATTL